MSADERPRTRCPRCNGKKDRRNPFCVACWQRLPEDLNYAIVGDLRAMKAGQPHDLVANLVIAYTLLGLPGDRVAADVERLR